jgi:acyl carrier protein
MTEAELRKSVLGNIAPEADLGALPPDRDLRESLDIDSMDFLNFVISLHEKLGVDIPEADLPAAGHRERRGRPHGRCGPRPT